VPPRVSVLMPAYNAQTTVASAVESVLRQTLTDFEIVLVDDGSTDATPGILDDLRRRDPRARVINAPHRGIIHALNIGIAECRAELIARMDADDISHPSRLEMQADFMRARPDISVCSSLVRMFPRKRLLGGMVRYERWLNSLLTPDEISRDMFVESPLAHPSAMVRRDELTAIGGYQERGWAEDYDLWLRYHAAGKRFCKVDRMLLFWRQTEGRLTFTDGRYSVENFLRAKAHYLARMLSGTNRPIVQWGAGKTGRRLIKHLLREGVAIDAVVDIDANKIGHHLRGRPIVSPDYLKSGPGPFVIAAVSSHGARELIRERLKGFGFVEVTDFLCAA
jgi:glycosyltransferase involved in cell wall biosynthesis